MTVGAPSSQSLNNFSAPLEGMANAMRKVNESAGAIANGEVNSSRMVDLMVGEKMYAANAAVVRTMDEMVGTLLNVKR